MLGTYVSLETAFVFLWEFELLQDWGRNYFNLSKISGGSKLALLVIIYTPEHWLMVIHTYNECILCNMRIGIKYLLSDFTDSNFTPEIEYKIIIK